LFIFTLFVLSNCKKYFITDKEWEEFKDVWIKVAYSDCEAVFKLNIQELQKYRNSCIQAFNYVNHTWLKLKRVKITIKHKRGGNNE
jgi:hypothetical protein